jgi:glycosidase
MTLVLTTRGTPQLYYGDEIGMAGNKEANGDGDIRRDFPGGWRGDVVNAFTNPTKEQKAYQDFTKKLLNYRKNKEVLHTGKLLQFVPENNCYVYFRYTDSSRVMVIINNNPEEITLDLARFKEGIQESKQGTEVLLDKEINLSNEIKIAGKSSMVLELE